MAPLIHSTVYRGAVLLASSSHPNEDVSKVGNKVVHEDSAGLLMFAAIFFVPFCIVVLAAAAWAMSRMDVEEKKMELVKSLQRQKSRLEAGIEGGLDATPGRKDPEEANEELQSTGLKSIVFTKMNITLLFVPIGFAAHFLHWGATTVFVLNCLAMLPLAGLMGVATEELACHTGQTIGGLLNATFGNAVELIFVVQSLRSGLVAVTKGTLLGSILANELLVLGMALLFGGLFNRDGSFAFNKQQSFSFTSAMIQSQLLLFSSFTIVIPSMFEKSYHIEPVHVLHLSRMGSVFAIVGYCIFMVFQLYTHADLMRNAEEAEEEEHASISVPVAIGLLSVATLLVAICSEFLVHGIDGFAHEMGFSQTFIGVVLLPIIGNACEHSTAILVAMKDKVTLSIGIAIGSTIQVSLFVVPFAVIVGWFLDEPMDLNFHRLNSWAMLLSCLLVMSVLVVGKSTWMNGVVLLSAYGILAFLYFLSPDDALA